MTGVETGALVVGIIALYPTIRHLVRDWKKNRDKQNRTSLADCARLKKLDQSLVASSTAIESEYGSHVQDLGNRFRVGDEASQLALSRVIMAQQDNLINILKKAALPEEDDGDNRCVGSGRSGAGVRGGDGSEKQSDSDVLDISSLLESSENVRRDTITAMSDLRRRLAVQRRLGTELGPPSYADIYPTQMDAETRGSDNANAERLAHMSGIGMEANRDGNGCHSRSFRKCPHAKGSGHGNLLKAGCPRCGVQAKEEVPGALAFRTGDIYLPWGKILMLGHVVCECYEPMDEKQLRYACIFCHCVNKSRYMPGQVWCQRGLHGHMLKEHQDRIW